MCRTYNGADINAEPGVNPQLKDGRGNLAPVTIILPTIAMLAKEKAEKQGKNIVDVFIGLLDTKIYEAKDMLLERFNHMCSQPAAAAKFMYENNTIQTNKTHANLRTIPPYKFKWGNMYIRSEILPQTKTVTENDGRGVDKHTK